MRAWILIGLCLASLCAGCSSDDSDGAGSGGASGMSSGGAGGAGAGGSGAGGTSGASGASGMGSGGMGAAAGTGGDIAVDPARADGQVVAPWDEYCVATFTEDFDIIGPFGDVDLSAKTGERYLLGPEGFSGGPNIIFIGEGGPMAIEMELEEGAALPFTSSCTGATEARIGVFIDTVVYSDEGLTMPVCTLQAGLTVPGSGLSYVIAGDGYQIIDFGELSEHCAGASEGFVESTNVATPSGGYFGVAFETLLAPAM